MVDVAKEVGAGAVCLGCTGKGNDQVRFELTFLALNPKLNIVAPWREWDIAGSEEAIEYARKHSVPVPVTKNSIFCRDRNVWHISHEVSVVVVLNLALVIVMGGGGVFTWCGGLNNRSKSRIDRFLISED
ncbi:unnamed protein product, partial [Vitis vinifera]|uniref:Arginosuccinate synthase-like N-terminal domain-containing protein n=1 Tax=Vitis vinifera TaxID=29760 RepID=E0CRY4_VITVI